MGSLLFDFLTESFLFRERLIDDKFSSLAELELDRELQRYREFCLSRRQELFSEATDGESQLRVFSGLHSVPLALLKQSALYVERHILPDPVFPLTERPTTFTIALRACLGQPDAQRINRIALADAITTLKALTPMVAADYVRLLPVTHQFEPPEQVPIYSSENLFSDGLPEDMLAFFYVRVLGLYNCEVTRWLSILISR